MIDFLIVLLTILGFILLLLSKEVQDVEEPYWSAGLAFVAMFIFFVLAFGVINIEIPYEMYNATSGNIETGSHVFGGDWELSRFYLGMAIFSVFVMLVYIFMPYRRLAERSESIRVKRKFKY